MSYEAPDGSESKEILQLLSTGCTKDGKHIMFSLQFEKGKNIEWYNFHHSKAGKIIHSLMFGSSVAKRTRPTKTKLGNSLPEYSELIDIKSFNAASAPGADSVVLRLSLDEGVDLDFAIPRELVHSMKEKLDQAVVIAQSGKSPSAH